MDKDKELSKLKKKYINLVRIFQKKIWYLQMAIKMHK